MYTVGLYTLGCKVSQYETEAIAEGFAARGFTVLPFDEVCDAYVINTCTVTRESDRKSRQVIRRAIKRNPAAVVACVGCYTQRTPDEVADIDGVDIVIGTDGKMTVIDRVIGRLESGRGAPMVSVTDLSCAEFEKMEIKRAPRTRAYIKIEDGCESRCTYCAIRSARGRVRSKEPSDVIREVEALTADGVPEIVLTGIETGSYGRDLGGDYTLADLIYELDRRGSARRLRLGSLAPELIGERFVERVRGASILAPHFHLSIQSGSDTVLARMRRRYTRARLIENIDRLRGAFPRATFTTDLMVGFPGESEEEFLDTFNLVSQIGLLDAHVFAYSRRTGTEADTFPDQIPEEVKRERSARLICEKDRVRDGILAAAVTRGEPLSAILETRHPDGTYTAHTDTYMELTVTARDVRDRCGETVWAHPVSSKNGIIYADLIEK